MYSSVALDYVWRPQSSLILVWCIFAVVGCARRGHSDDPPEVAAVRATMQEDCFERNMFASQRPNPKGLGTVVILGNCAYLVKEGKVYAISDLAAKYSPGVQRSKELTLEDVLGHS